MQNYSRNRRGDRLWFALAIIVAALLIAPILWLLLTSVKADSEFLRYPIELLPSSPRWNNYVEAVTRVPFFRYALNSLVITLIYSILAVTTSALAGFAFARLEAPGRGRLFGIVVALLMVPYIVYIIPQFVIFSRLGLPNTILPWVLWGLAASPFHIFLFRQFFLTFPKELEDAAEVDGCSILRMFWQIFLPNARAVLAVSFILNFIQVWDDWFTQLIFLSGDNITLAVALSKAYVDDNGYPLITISVAATVLYTIPLVIIFILAQKHIMEGYITTGIRG
ncbi:MAG: ABC transporter permease subunit [Chloroflexi bacterium]|nr:ABC transporter permease subunit [Chloroflexota bacterium]